jgi:pimeloyl-ACP methyl ester carboxylesterase
MRFRCPSCGFAGRVQIPAHFPRGRRASIRCSQCRKPFNLAVGRLWPQDSAQSYDALIAGALDCQGEMIGTLWVETVGSRSGSNPLVALQPHPSLSHEILHDLLDQFKEYFTICYLEFPGSAWCPDAPAERHLLTPLLHTLDLIKLKLKADKLHLLGHLDSCRLALRVAQIRPREIASLMLLEPLLSGPPPSLPVILWSAGGLQQPTPAAAAEAVRSLATGHWRLPAEEVHLRGLAQLLSHGFTPERFRQGEAALRYRPRHGRLSRLRVPALIASARDGSPAARGDALFLAANLPAGELAALEEGGGMAAWSGSSWLANKLMAFKRNAEKVAQEQTRRRAQMVSGQPLAWMTLLFAVITWGLAWGLGQLTFQPDFAAKVLPTLLGALLPILWFLLPRRMNPFILLRFRAFCAETVLLPLIIGGLLGSSFFSLSAADLTWKPPGAYPPFLLSLPLGSPGRPYLLLALAFQALFVYGFLQSLLSLRRSRWRQILPLLLAVLVPLSFPDALWALPAALASVLLFGHTFSVFAPLFLLAGVFVGSELPARYPAIPASLAGAQGWILALVLLIGAAFLTALLLTGKRTFNLETRYYSENLNRDERAYRWRKSGGTVLVIFSLLGAGALVFAFVLQIP